MPTRPHPRPGSQRTAPALALTLFASGCLLTATPEELLSGGHADARAVVVQDAGQRDAGAPDHGGADRAATPDQLAFDTLSTDAAPPAEAGQDDVEGVDVAQPDQGEPDALHADAAIPDTAALDAGPADGAVADASLSDAPLQDASALDAAPLDAAALDAALPDTAPPDTSTPDAALPDTALPDTAPPDNAGGADASVYNCGEEGVDPGPLASCSSRNTLESLVQCFHDYMPQRDSNDFQAPSPEALDAWQWTVERMLAGECGFALPTCIAVAAEVYTFTDRNNDRAYCVLAEARDPNNDGDVDRGWGLVIVDPSAIRELSQQAPHAMYELDTEYQAVTIFKETQSRSYLCSGAHRYASSASSPCQSSNAVTDVAHNDQTMFHAANEALVAHYGSAGFVALQWHGMGASSCSCEVFLSDGIDHSPAPGDAIVALHSNVSSAHGSWDVDLVGASSCSLVASTNIQGRLLNGVAPGAVCGTDASVASGRFISVEQDPGFRDAADWIGAIEATWP